MRRHSPTRSMRHQAPPKRQNRGRSVSPLSRRQPSPPGEERPPRRQAPLWEPPQERNNKRQRSRSRPREWLEDALGPSFARDRHPKGNSFDKPRDMKEPKMFVGPPGRMQPAEESYLDHHGNNLHNLHFETILDPSSISFNTYGPGPLPLMKASPKLEKPRNIHEPARNQHKSRDLHPPRDSRRSPRESMRYSPPRNSRRSPLRESRDEIRHSPPREMRRSPPREMRHSPPREMRRSPPRETRRSPPRNSRHSSPPREAKRPPPPRNRGKESPHKSETATERIKRLEKLVEKLVEEKPAINSKPKDYGYQDPKGAIRELIPSNTKYTTSMWLNSINEECLLQGYDEKSCIRFLHDQMTGVIKSWSKTLMDFNFTWPEFKMLITKTFPDNIDFAQTLRLLTSRDKSPDETITHYFFSKVYLCEACKITGENAVSCLIDGLNNPFMKQEIKNQNFLTPELLYSECLSKFPDTEVPMRVSREVAGAIMEIEEDYQEGNPYQQTEFYNARPGESFSARKCYTCNKVGHLAVDCRHAPICYICKKKGHIAKKCHYNNQEYNNTVALIFGNNGAQKIPKINCLINEQEFNAILDTGSVAVTLKQSVAQKLSLILKPTREVLAGFGGLIIKPSGEAEVQLKVDEVRRGVTALVVEDSAQEAPVIIGQEFLAKEGVVFYQSNGQVSVMDD